MRKHGTLGSEGGPPFVSYGLRDLTRRRSSPSRATSLSPTRMVVGRSESSISKRLLRACQIDVRPARDSGRHRQLPTRLCDRDRADQAGGVRSSGSRPDGAQATSATTVARASGSHRSSSDRRASSPLSMNALIACAYEDREDELHLAPTQGPTSATVVGICGSATSASPTRPGPSRSSVSTALILAP